LFETESYAQPWDLCIICAKVITSFYLNAKIYLNEGELDIVQFPTEYDKFTEFRQKWIANYKKEQFSLSNYIRIFFIFEFSLQELHLNRYIESLLWLVS
jgi:hypothetical protein